VGGGGRLSASEDRILRRDWALFTGQTFLFFFGFAIYNGVFQNFLRDEMRAGPLALGGLESLREVPGLLTALTAGTLVALAEARLGAFGLLTGAIGIALSGFMPGYWGLVAVSVGWSVGFHLYLAVAPAITLALAKGEEGGRHLGRMTAVGSSATLAALAVAWLAARFLGKPAYSVYFVTGGACIAGAALLCSRLSAHSGGGPREPLVYRREYGLYYLLTFLEGCRRQIFAIFASFALILVYGVPVERMLLLQFVNAALIAVTAPHIGRLIDRRGERGPLTFYAVSLIVVFAGYAVSTNVTLLVALFLLDNVLFTFGNGLTTYLHRIVRPGELTPCLSMGLTMNHIAAVSVPVLGAWLWQSSADYRLPFWVGSGIAVVALFATQRLPKGPAQPEIAR
jgi:MFS family permease